MVVGEVAGGEEEVGGGEEEGQARLPDVVRDRRGIDPVGSKVLLLKH